MTSATGRTTALAPPLDAFAHAVGRALEEDLGDGGDPTSRGLGSASATAALVAREPGTLAGLPAVALTLDAVAARLGTPRAEVELLAADGDAVEAGAVLARVDGPARTLLGAERTLLNLVGRLTGVATLTAAFVSAVAGTGAVVRDTRKTTPGLRALEKYAVRCGGGANHRMGLYDALLVKDNHIAAAGSLPAAVDAARATAPDLPLEVEVETLEEVDAALAAGCELLLLDNMPLERMTEAVRLATGLSTGRLPPRNLGVGGRSPSTEASGGITLATAAAVASTGVDYLAVGALTHSAPAVDVALDWASA